MSAHWIAVACAEHVRRGREHGFMQVCHGKGAPLRRIRPGDGVVYYSPTVVFGRDDGFRTLTAIGAVRDAKPYQFDMGGCFIPFRRDVDWTQADETPIRPLLCHLEFTAGKPNWGYQLRFGLIAISARDFGVIASAMGAHILAAGLQLRPSAYRLDQPGSA